MSSILLFSAFALVSLVGCSVSPICVQSNGRSAKARAALFANFEAVSDLKLVQPALTGNEVGRRAELQGLVLDHLGSNLLLVAFPRAIPIIELLLHIRVLSLTAPSFLPLPADLHPALQ